jgi:hypothetical protein
MESWSDQRLAACYYLSQVYAKVLHSNCYWRSLFWRGSYRSPYQDSGIPSTGWGTPHWGQLPLFSISQILWHLRRQLRNASLYTLWHKWLILTSPSHSGQGLHFCWLNGDWKRQLSCRSYKQQHCSTQSFFL